MVRKGSRRALWGEEGLAPTSVSVLGRKVHVIVLVIYCRFLGGHDRILRRDWALQSDQQVPQCSFWKLGETFTITSYNMYVLTRILTRSQVQP